MGAVKHAMMEESERNYHRNRYYHERQKLLVRIQRYADRPGFVARLKQELKTLERNWKDSTTKTTEHSETSKGIKGPRIISTARAENAHQHAAGTLLDEKCEACGFYLQFDGRCPSCEN